MEKPILFSTPMVRAILEGRKTQTRRVCKNPPVKIPIEFQHEGCSDYGFEKEPNPRYRVGDRLWVRETWAAPHSCDHLPPRLIPQGARIHFAATENLGGLIHRPSIFMPRWASRITLEVTEVRVERLQDISEEDAISEGVDVWFENLKDRQSDNVWNLIAKAAKKRDTNALLTNEVDKYAVLWDSINGKKYPWDSNPFCWVISFVVVKE
jgi:hypothetical protein